jgi:hypothetical protein
MKVRGQLHKPLCYREKNSLYPLNMRLVDRSQSGHFRGTKDYKPLLASDV